MAILQGPKFIDFDARMRDVQYRVTEHIRTYMSEWASLLVDVRAKIDIKWEDDLQHQRYVMKVYVNSWVYNMHVERELFDYVHKDVHYLEYIRENCLRACQTGILCEWLDQLYINTEDKYDLSKMWREDLALMVNEIHLHKAPGTDRQACPVDLVTFIFKNNPVPYTELVGAIQEEPKLLLARLTMLKT